MSKNCSLSIDQSHDLESHVAIWHTHSATASLFPAWPPGALGAWAALLHTTALMTILIAFGKSEVKSASLGMHAGATLTLLSNQPNVNNQPKAKQLKITQQPKNTTRKISASLLLIVTLIACESSHNPPASPTKFATLTPPMLRSIDIANLSARVTISNMTNTYFAADFPDDRWLIEFELQPSQTYDITIEWFADTYLVLEETGQIFTNPDEFTIKPALEFISAGYDRFDADCDGVSNIEEFIHGTDPDSGTELTESTCTDIADDSRLREEQTAWIIKQLQPLESAEFMERVTTYEQAIQVSIFDPGQSVAYGVSLRTAPTEDEAHITTRIDLVNDLENGKQLRFRIDRAPDPDTFIAANPNCTRYQAGYACTIDYEWNEQQWYSVKFEEISNSNWQGSVRPVTAGVSQTIATIETESNVSWHRPQAHVSTINSVTAAQCKLGLAPLSLRYAPGVANSVYTVSSLHTVLSNCIRAGAGWSEGIRTIDDQQVHYLTLGKAD